MTFPKHISYYPKIDFVLVDFARLKKARISNVFAETRTENTVGEIHCVTIGIDIDELARPISVTPVCGREQYKLDGSGDFQVFLHWGTRVTQHVRTHLDRTLIERPPRHNVRRAAVGAAHGDYWIVRVIRELVRLFLTGQSYKGRVLKSRGQTIKQLADEMGVSRSYFTRALRLVYLAPDIVQSILSGTQPPELTARKLKSASRLPLNWVEQRALLGFD